LGKVDLDHVLNNYTQDVKGWVKVTTIHALDDFHVLDGNINFGLI
jgi:hypothetical protein